jgi:cytochrome oxidase Cu insertion factor (SCO1/SenC/PrrC family)
MRSTTAGGRRLDAETSHRRLSPQPFPDGRGVDANVQKVLAALALSAALWLLPSGQAAAGLQEFRAPNELEKAYLWLAAELGRPELCEKISPDALNRVRKPTIVRSHCYYYVALNTRDAALCASVEPVPVGAGVMNWLTPERCEVQIGRLQASEKPYVPAFQAAAALREMGYGPDDLARWTGKDGAIDGLAAFRTLSAPGTAREDFVRRLDRLPDFSRVSRAEDQLLFFTRQQEDRELYWVVNHGIKLCLAGHGGPNCNEQSYTLFRKNKEDFARFLGDGRAKVVPARAESQADAPSGYREPTQIESASYDVAVRQNDPALCDKIAPEALAIGWSIDPGLVFMSLRSACTAAIAVRTRDERLCASVRPLERPDIDGDGLTPEFCRGMVAGSETPVHKLTVRPSWQKVLTALGYGEADLPPTRPQDAWLALADRVMDRRNPENAEFVARLGASDPAAAGEGRVLNERELQSMLYQFAVVRFHCSINQAAGKYVFQGYSLKAPKDFGGAFELVDHHGNKVTDQDFRGKHLLVYFGYTYCPDVCPTSLWTIAEALRSLGELADQVQPVFISVDPGRDTPEQLAGYVELFHPSLIGLTGEPAAIRKAAKAYQAYYFVGEVDGEYVVDHTSWSYFLDPEGKALGHFDHGIDPAAMADRIRHHINGES